MPRLVHFADSHIGHRRFDRMNRAGLNVREADIAATFTRTIDRIIELRPDVIVHAGDLFDAPKPPNAAVIHGFAQFQRLRQALPETPIVIVAGNHDRGRASDTGCILGLFRTIGCHVAIAAPQRFTFGEVSVLAVPELPKLPALAPDDARYPVLLLHGEIDGVVKGGKKGIPADALNAPSWRYVALGHYHVMHEVAQNACYSGATDYSSSDVWGELRDEAACGVPGKGFLEIALESGARTFHPVAPSRRWMDLEPIDVAGRGADDVSAEILARLAEVPGGIADAVVRLKVLDCPITVSRAFDHAAIRKAKARALNVQIDIRRPKRETSVMATMPKRGASVPELMEWHIQQREIPADVDKAALLRLGQHYLDEALKPKDERQAGESANAA